MINTYSFPVNRQHINPDVRRKSGLPVDVMRGLSIRISKLCLFEGISLLSLKLALRVIRESVRPSKTELIEHVGLELGFLFKRCLMLPALSHLSTRIVVLG
jgi:hypothetical protein